MKFETPPKTEIAVKSYETEVSASLPGSSIIGDVLDCFLGMLLSIGYQQESIDDYILERADLIRARCGDK